jgi:hypothetical protein
VSTARSVYPPIRGRAFDLYFKVQAEDGSDLLAPAGLAGRVVVDGRPYDLRRPPQLVDAATGTCKATLPPNLTLGATILFTGTSTTAGSRAYSERIHTAAQTLDQQASRERRRKIGGWR